MAGLFAGLAGQWIIENTAIAFSIKVKLSLIIINNIDLTFVDLLEIPSYQLFNCIRDGFKKK